MQTRFPLLALTSLALLGFSGCVPSDSDPAGNGGSFGGDGEGGGSGTVGSGGNGGSGSGGNVGSAGAIGGGGIVGSAGIVGSGGIAGGSGGSGRRNGGSAGPSGAAGRSAAGARKRGRRGRGRRRGWSGRSWGQRCRRGGRRGGAGRRRHRWRGRRSWGPADARDGRRHGGARRRPGRRRRRGSRWRRAGRLHVSALEHVDTASAQQLRGRQLHHRPIPRGGRDNWDPTAGLGAASSFTANFTVAADGSGTHTTVQAALTAAASGTARRYILVKPGTYRGVVSISGSTPITLYGADTDATRVVIVNSNSAADAGGTSGSATFTTKAAGFQLMNLTISNDFATPTSGSNIQAVALYTTGDKTVLQNVRLHGFQDTFYADSSSATAIARVYVKDSFIEGDTDFIFGRAVLVIDGGTIHYLSSRKGTGSGVHFAPSTHVDNMYGFLATRVNFTAESGAPSNKISLGRSWDQSSTTPTPNGQAVVRESMLGGHISQTAPWAAAATSGRAYSATGNRFNEYCNSGPGAGP